MIGDSIHRSHEGSPPLRLAAVGQSLPFFARALVVGVLFFGCGSTYEFQQNVYVFIPDGGPGPDVEVTQVKPRELFLRQHQQAETRNAGDVEATGEASIPVELKP